MGFENYKNRIARRVAIPGLCAMTAIASCGTAAKVAADPGADPCRIALAPAGGDTLIDQQIEKLQLEIRKDMRAGSKLERLGWLFVSKARANQDPGYYRLAGQTALCLAARQPEDPAAALLQGHILHNLHRFREAEGVARKLVETRGSPFDHGLLGDVVMEMGRLDEAAASYQKMVDLKPGWQSYSRAAHLRWLRGDVTGAVDLMRLAARSSSPRAGEATAWLYARLAQYEMQAGNSRQALRAVAAALGLAADYPPALLVRGRIHLAQGRAKQAVEDFTLASAAASLPEYQWWLAESLRSAGRGAEADAMESKLRHSGTREDPRTLALFLATRSEDPATAVQLARGEIESRKDVFTLDALAWALRAAGNVAEARQHMRSALREGTSDARLFLHAGLIEIDAGDREAGLRWLAKAQPLRHMLMPSERSLLDLCCERSGPGRESAGG